MDSVAQTPERALYPEARPGPAPCWRQPLNPQQPHPSPSCSAGKKLPVQLPCPPAPSGGETHRVAAEAAVELIDGPHQHDAARFIRFVEKPDLHIRSGIEIKENDAGLLVTVAVVPDRCEAGERRADELAAIARRDWQLHRQRGVMLRIVGLEPVGLDKHHEVCGRQMLPPQFLGACPPHRKRPLPAIPAAVTGRPKEREAMMLLRSEISCSRSRHGTARRAVRAPGAW